MNQIEIITSSKNWMEYTAVSQLNALSQLEGTVRAVGLPDLHAGKSPVGFALLSQGRFYPHLIGGDIGCGMSLFLTEIPIKKYKQDRWKTKLNHLKSLLDIPFPIPQNCSITDFGTIGSGNHFAEFQCVDSSEELLSIPRNMVLLLIHSGSRNFGQQIWEKFHDPTGILAGSSEEQHYFRFHNEALYWATQNRICVAKKLISYLGFSKQPHLLLDCPHNFLEKGPNGYIHRKGAVSASHGPVVIPGSRGSLTYVVTPTAETACSLDSLSHGAGRKWARSLCKSRIRDKYDRDTIRTTPLKNAVVCHDTDLLFQEAPEAYKKVEHIIQSLQERNLIAVSATLRPLITVKL